EPSHSTAQSMTSKKILGALIVSFIIVVACFWLLERATLGRTLRLLRQDTLRVSLDSARQLAKDDYRLRQEQHLPTEGVRAHADQIDRGLMVLEELDILQDEIRR